MDNIVDLKGIISLLSLRHRRLYAYIVLYIWSVIENSFPLHLLVAHTYIIFTAPLKILNVVIKLLFPPSQNYQPSSEANKWFLASRISENKHWRPEKNGANTGKTLKTTLATS